MSLLYLTREDVAGLLPSISDQLDLVEETYRAVGAGRVELPAFADVEGTKENAA